ncbi:hypothetical protein FRC09_018324, partial [Ceratobasidium sp. 395]
IFKEPTDRFSQSENPLIHEILPEMLALRARLYNIRDDIPKKGLHRIMTHASQLKLRS